MTTTSHHATAAFEVDAFEPQSSEEWAGASFGTMHLAKTFTGAVEGTSVVRMVAVTTQVETSRSYAAFELLTVSVDGRAGTFVLQHGAAMSELPGQGFAHWSVVPNSGTGELTGITGTAAIDQDADGNHTFSLDYSLPG